MIRKLIIILYSMVDTHKAFRALNMIVAGEEFTTDQVDGAMDGLF